MRVAPDGEIAWNLHYFPVGEEVPGDVVEVGLWFYEEDYQPEFETIGERLFRVDGLNGMARGQDIVIPPHGYQVLQGTHYLESLAVIHSYRPHLHMRGKVMSMEAIYPDGTKEVISQVNKYDHNWQVSYIYEDDVKPILPKLHGDPSTNAPPRSRHQRHRFLKTHRMSFRSLSRVRAPEHPRGIPTRRPAKNGDCTKRSESPSGDGTVPAFREPWAGCGLAAMRDNT